MSAAQRADKDILPKVMRANSSASLTGPVSKAVTKEDEEQQRRQRDALFVEMLHQSCSSGEVMSVYRLLEHATPALVNSAPDGGSAPIFAAIAGKHWGVVKMMLELGSIDVNVVQSFTRNTPLLMMLKVVTSDGPDEVAVAAAMLSKGVNCSARDSDGHDAMSVALRRRLPQLQLLLMKHAKEAEVRLFNDPVTNGEWIVDACTSGNRDGLHQLLSHNISTTRPSVTLALAVCIAGHLVNRKPQHRNLQFTACSMILLRNTAGGGDLGSANVALVDLRSACTREKNPEVQSLPNNGQKALQPFNWSIPSVDEWVVAVEDIQYSIALKGADCSDNSLHIGIIELAMAVGASKFIHTIMAPPPPAATFINFTFGPFSVIDHIGGVRSQERDQGFVRKDSSYYTALTFAVRTGDLLLLKQLLDHGNSIDVNLTPSPPPGQLSGSSSMDCSRMLANFSSLHDRSSVSGTPIMWAIALGNVGAFNLLASHPNVDIHALPGCPPLHVVASDHRIETALRLAVLNRQVAFVSKCLSGGGVQGDAAALLIAVSNNDVEILVMLLQAAIKTETWHLDELLKLPIDILLPMLPQFEDDDRANLVDVPELTSASDASQSTPHWAAHAVSSSQCRLIDGICQSCPYSYRQLQRALIAASSAGLSKVFHILLAVSISLRSPPSQKTMAIMLSSAVSNSHSDFIVYLADISLLPPWDENSTAPIGDAVAAAAASAAAAVGDYRSLGHLACNRRVAASPVNEFTSVTPFTKNTPLLISAFEYSKTGSQSHLACCCLLMRRGADVNASDEDGSSRFVLLLLLLGGVWDPAAAEAVAMAIECGAQVSTCDSQGNTALAAALCIAESHKPQNSVIIENTFLPFLEVACVRLLRDGGATCIPDHAHVQFQNETATTFEQQPLLLTCVGLRWRQLALALVSKVPLHPARQILLEICSLGWHDVVDAFLRNWKLSHDGGEGCLTDLEDEDGGAGALHCAVANGHIECVGVLLIHGFTRNIAQCCVVAAVKGDEICLLKLFTYTNPMASGTGLDVLAAIGVISKDQTSCRNLNEENARQYQRLADIALLLPLLAALCAWHNLVDPLIAICIAAWEAAVDISGRICVSDECKICLCSAALLPLSSYFEASPLLCDRVFASPLHIAAAHGATSAAAVLLSINDASLDVNAVDSQGNTALMWAMRSCCLPLAKLLLIAGADVHINEDHVTRHLNSRRAESLWTRLLSAIGKGIKELGRDYLDKKPEPAPFPPPAVWGKEGSPSLSAMLWAAVSGCNDGIKLLMECGCDAVAAKSWFASFDLTHKSHSPKRQAVVEVSQGVTVKVKTEPGIRRHAPIPVSSTAATANQSIKMLGCCIEEGGNVVHNPFVAPLYKSEPFAPPSHSEIKWTSRVRGVSMQLGWSDWRLTRVQFVTDDVAALHAASECQTHQKLQTSDGMRLWLPILQDQYISTIEVLMNKDGARAIRFEISQSSSGWASFFSQVTKSGDNDTELDSTVAHWTRWYGGGGGRAAEGHIMRIHRKGCAVVGCYGRRLKSMIVCIGFATRSRSQDFAWAALGGGSDRRGDWGYSGVENFHLKRQFVSWTRDMSIGGSDGALNVWYQHLEQQHHLLTVRRSIIASPPTAMPPSSPSKFSFVPKDVLVSSQSLIVDSPNKRGQQELPSCFIPELMQLSASDLQELKRKAVATALNAGECNDKHRSPTDQSPMNTDEMRVEYFRDLTHQESRTIRGRRTLGAFEVIEDTS